MAGQMPLFLLPLAFFFDAVAADLHWPGNLFVRRQISKCLPIGAIPLRSPKVIDNCLLYHFADLQHPATHRVMYVRDGDRQRYQLRLVTLGVKGHLGNQDLSSFCFTKEFYGDPPVHCIGGTQAAVLHIGADNRLYKIDVLLSPAGLPQVESLAAHRPSSGVAQLRFPRGIPLHAADYLQVCQQTTPSAICDQELLAEAAPLPSHPGALGVGQVVLTPSGFSARTEFVVDRANQLMASAVGDRRSYFNSDGSFVSEDQTCTESPAKTFASQLRAYDAQFLDHVGTITAAAPAWAGRASPGTAGAAPVVAAVLALGVLAAALLKASSGATPFGFHLPQRNPTAYKTFELP